MDGPVLLVANPGSRRGEAAYQAAAALARHGIASLAAEWDPARLGTAIRARAAEVRAVVVAGGDGTLNAAAEGVAATGLPLGILPTGTANDLARTLGLPGDLDEAARVIAAGHLRRIDLGMANDVPFFNVASIGLGVDLTRALTRDSKRRWGKLGYAVAGLRVLRRMQPFRAWITLDGETRISRTIHVAVGNGRHYGGGMLVAGDATIDDGRLDAFSLEVSGIWALLRLLPALRAGRHEAWQEIHAATGQAVDIRTSRRRSVNTDGEIRTHTPARFTVRPGAVSVFVPE